MNVRSALLASLSAGLCGCPLFCNPPEEDRTVDADVHSNELSREDAEGPDACFHACSAAYSAETGWSASKIGACEFTRADDAAWPEDTGDSPTGVGHVTCDVHGIEYICEGRRPLGLRTPAIADTLACFAWLEAASVLAFEQLGAQLEQFGAPTTLVARCAAAAEDERRHAAVLGAIARRRGGTVPDVHVASATYDLLAVAIHNAVEGCVHETWAAVEAAWLAHRGADEELRTAFLRISEDEAAHAQLAWDVHTWLMSRLSATERTEVHHAQRVALGTLPRRAMASARGSARLGSPDPTTAHVMATVLAETLAV